MHGNRLHWDVYCWDLVDMLVHEIGLCWFEGGGGALPEDTSRKGQGSKYRIRLAGRGRGGGRPKSLKKDVKVYKRLRLDSLKHVFLGAPRMRVPPGS